MYPIHYYSDGDGNGMAPQYPSAPWPAVPQPFDCVPPTPPRPTAFPRNDWSTAVWTPPALSFDFVTPPLFQLAGKFASDAVKDALDGRKSWDNVGSHGIILALADLMLQWCAPDYGSSLMYSRDVLRHIHCAEVVRNGTPGYPRHTTFESWHDEYRHEAERIIAIVSTSPDLAGC